MADPAGIRLPGPGVLQTKNIPTAEKFVRKGVIVYGINIEDTKDGLPSVARFASEEWWSICAWVHFPFLPQIYMFSENFTSFVITCGIFQPKIKKDRLEKFWVILPPFMGKIWGSLLGCN